MSTHMQGFSHFLGLLHHLVMAKLSTSSMRVNCVVVVIIIYLSVHVLIVPAFAIQLAMLVTLACWMPHFKQAYVMYIIAALWGIGDANLMSQSNSKYT